jgi:hypothetical protein
MKTATSMQNHHVVIKFNAVAVTKKFVREIVHLTASHLWREPPRRNNAWAIANVSGGDE